jgi:aminomethyltransferase
MTLSSTQADCQAALESTLVVHHRPPGALSMSGGDRLDLLHRLSTNDLIDLPDWSRRSTVFTNPIGRVIDVTQMLNLEQELILMTSPGRARIVMDWIGQHIFFQDDVQISESAERWTYWGVYGPAAQDQVAEVVGDLDLSQIRENQSGLLWRVEVPIAGIEFLTHAGKQQELLEDASSSTREIFEALRIERGVPQFGKEVTDRSIPLEAGLRSSISFTKGCYIGQEIIARMDSRSQYSRELIGVQLSSRADPEFPIRVDSRQIGQITSCAHSPRFGWMGLAIIRTGNAIGTKVAVGPDAVQGTLVSLPFAQSLSS